MKHFRTRNLRSLAINCIEGTETDMKVESFLYQWKYYFKDLGLEQVPDGWTIVLIEFPIKTRKWLCISLYKWPSQNNNYFLDNLSLILNKLACKFDNIVFMGDFNLSVENKNLFREFLWAHLIWNAWLKNLH